MRLALALLLLLLALPLHLAGPVAAATIGTPAFLRVWQRTDLPVQQGAAGHSWVWGPEATTAVLGEAYDSAPGGRRQVQYFDKSRMEINTPQADPTAEWYVTNGLLVNELVLGTVQVADDRYLPLPPARIGVAGDLGAAFPTYADLATLYNRPANRPLGERVAGVLQPDGSLVELPWLAGDRASEIVSSTRGFGLPRAFWEFLNQTSTVFEGGELRPGRRLFNWLFVTGYPTSEAFWARVPVGGVERDVLIQAFERRVLTYTPSNPEAFRVEMGNVGQHYYRWRYAAPFAGGQRAVITNPPAGGLAGNPLLVQGFESGAAPEAGLSVRLRSKASGAPLARAAAAPRRPGVALAGPFETQLAYSPPDGGQGILELYSTAPGNGAETVLTSQEVTFVVDRADTPRALISAPRPDTVVKSPLVVSGFENGTAFEAAIVIQLRSLASGVVVARAPTRVRRPAVAQPGPFDARLVFPPAQEPYRATVEVVVASPLDRLETIVARQEVTVAASYLFDQAALVTAPLAGAIVSGPLSIAGRENGLSPDGRLLIRLHDATSGQALASSTVTVGRPAPGQPGLFTLTLTVTRPITDSPALLVVERPGGAGEPGRILTTSSLTLVGVEPGQAQTPMGAWQLQAITTNGPPGLSQTIAEPERYTLEFLPGGQLAIRADCSRGGGSVVVSGSRIDLSTGGVTRATCAPDSLAEVYLAALDGAISFWQQGNSLDLALPEPGGSLRFGAAR